MIAKSEKMLPVVAGEEYHLIQLEWPVSL